MSLPEKLLLLPAVFVILVASCATWRVDPEIVEPDVAEEEEILDRITAEVEKGNVNRALEIYEKGIVDDPLLYSMLLLNTGRIDKAEKALTEVLEKNSRDTQALFYMSLVHNFRGDRPEEKKVLEKIISLDSAHPDAGLALGWIYAAESKYGRAENFFKKLIDAETSAHDLEARLGYAYVLKQLGSDKEAYEQYSTVIENDPDNMIAYIDRGIIRALQEDYKGAEEDFSEAVRIDPDYLWNYIDRGRVRFYSGRIRGAVDDFSRALEIDSSLFTAYAQRAEAYEILGENDLALKDYEKALDIRGDYYRGFVPAASQYFRLEKWDKAAHYFLKAYELDESYELVLLGAACLIKNREKDKAEKLLKEKMNTVSRDSSLFHISRLFVDPAYEAIAIRRINDENNSFERYKGLFYLALYYDSYGKNLLSEKYYSTIIESEFPPDTLEYRLSYWRVSS